MPGGRAERIDDPSPRHRRHACEPFPAHAYTLHERATASTPVAVSNHARHTLPPTRSRLRSPSARAWLFRSCPSQIDRSSQASHTSMEEGRTGSGSAPTEFAEVHPLPVRADRQRSDGAVEQVDVRTSRPPPPVTSPTSPSVAPASRQTVQLAHRVRSRCPARRHHSYVPSPSRPRGRARPSGHHRRSGVPTTVFSDFPPPWQPGPGQRPPRDCGAARRLVDLQHVSFAARTRARDTAISVEPGAWSYVSRRTSSRPSPATRRRRLNPGAATPSSILPAYRINLRSIQVLAADGRASGSVATSPATSTERAARRPGARHPGHHNSS